MKTLIITLALIFATYLAAENSVNTNKNNTPMSLADWQQQQDSLRNELLKNKDNKILKESFLQEMYIRDLIKVSDDSLLVTIPFNVHSNDCGAPDCYVNEVSFCFKLTDALIFPSKIRFYESEYGCVPSSQKISGIFLLTEQNDDIVIYHSAKHKRTLVLFRSNNKSGTYAFYFTDVNKNSITDKNVYNIRNEYNEEDPKSLYPFTSTILNWSEYNYFLP